MRGAAALLLLSTLQASCGSEEQGQHQRDREIARSDSLPVMGRERRIAVIAGGALSGRGLAGEDSFHTRLELALRARGVNARITVLRPGGPLPDPLPELIITEREASNIGDGSTLPVLHIDPDAILTGKPDLLLDDGVHPNALGVEELVMVAGKQAAAIFSAPAGVRELER